MNGRAPVTTTIARSQTSAASDGHRFPPFEEAAPVRSHASRVRPAWFREVHAEDTNSALSPSA